MLWTHFLRSVCEDACGCAGVSARALQVCRQKRRWKAAARRAAGELGPPAVPHAGVDRTHRLAAQIGPACRHLALPQLLLQLSGCKFSEEEIRELKQRANLTPDGDISYKEFIPIAIRFLHSDKHKQMEAEAEAAAAAARAAGGEVDPEVLKNARPGTRGCNCVIS